MPASTRFTMTLAALLLAQSAANLYVMNVTAGKTKLSTTVSVKAPVK